MTLCAISAGAVVTRNPLCRHPQLRNRRRGFCHSGRPAAIASRHPDPKPSVQRETWQLTLPRCTARERDFALCPVQGKCFSCPRSARAIAMSSVRCLPHPPDYVRFEFAAARSRCSMSSLIPFSGILQTCPELLLRSGRTPWALAECLLHPVDRRQTRAVVIDCVERACRSGPASMQSTLFNGCRALSGDSRPVRHRRYGTPAFRPGHGVHLKDPRTPGRQRRLHRLCPRFGNRTQVRHTGLIRRGSHTRVSADE